jgi:hypothetical protein
MVNTKAPDRVFDAIYPTRRELFPNRTLTEPSLRSKSSYSTAGQSGSWLLERLDLRDLQRLAAKF